VIRRRPSAGCRWAIVQVAEKDIFYIFWLKTGDTKQVARDSVTKVGVGLHPRAGAEGGGGRADRVREFLPEIEDMLSRLSWNEQLIQAEAAEQRGFPFDADNPAGRLPSFMPGPHGEGALW
jgi:hypothetical protein